MFGKLGKMVGAMAGAARPAAAAMGVRGPKGRGPAAMAARLVGGMGMKGDPGAARRAQLATGPYGGSVATQGAGGFKTMDAPAVAPGPPPPGPVEGMGMAAPAEGMKAAWQAEMSPYGPAQIRPENAPNRMLARRTAGMQMF